MRERRVSVAARHSRLRRRLARNGSRRRRCFSRRHCSRKLYTCLSFTIQTETGASCPNTNFLKGVAWSPDGACLLTASEDRLLRVFDLPRDALERAPEADDGGDDDTDGGGGGGDANAAAAAMVQEGRRRNGGAGDSLRPALRAHAGEAVYDFAWFPGMSAADPASCCFASTARVSRRRERNKRGRQKERRKGVGMGLNAAVLQ